MDRYKQLLLKQRDIMIALTQRLNERDEQIMALQDELDANDARAVRALSPRLKPQGKTRAQAVHRAPPALKKNEDETWDKGTGVISVEMRYPPPPFFFFGGRSP